MIVLFESSRCAVRINVKQFHDSVRFCRVLLA